MVRIQALYVHTYQRDGLGIIVYCTVIKSAIITVVTVAVWMYKRTQSHLVVCFAGEQEGLASHTGLSAPDEYEVIHANKCEVVVIMVISSFFFERT